MKHLLLFFRRLTGIVFLLAALCGMSLLSAFNTPPPEKEKLLGLSFNYDKSEVTIMVYTTGCTTKADFQFKVNGSNLQVLRLKRDACKMVPQATSFTYTLAEAGLKPDRAYVITNKFVASPLLAAIP